MVLKFVIGWHQIIVDTVVQRTTVEVPLPVKYFCRNIAYLTPKIIYFYYLNKIFRGSKYPSKKLFQKKYFTDDYAQARMHPHCWTPNQHRSHEAFSDLPSSPAPHCELNASCHFLFFSQCRQDAHPFLSVRWLRIQGQQQDVFDQYHSHVIDSSTQCFFLQN